MKDNADAEHGGQRQRGGEAEGVEEREDAEETVRFVEGDGLAELLDVGLDV